MNAKIRISSSSSRFQTFKPPTMYSEEQASLLSVVATRKKNFHQRLFDHDFVFNLTVMPRRFSRKLNHCDSVEFTLHGETCTFYTSQEELFFLLACKYGGANFRHAPYRIWLEAFHALCEQYAAFLRSNFKISLQLSKLQPKPQKVLVSALAATKKEPEEIFLLCTVTSEDFSASGVICVPKIASASLAKLLVKIWPAAPLVTKVSSAINLNLPIVLGSSRLPVAYFSSKSRDAIKIGDILLFEESPMLRNLANVWLDLGSNYLTAQLQAGQLCLEEKIVPKPSRSQ